MAQLNYDVNAEELESSYDPVPAGQYNVIITESAYEDNKSKTGKILKLTYQIMEGPFKDKKIFENLNLIHSNKQAEEISRKAFNSIGVALGFNKVEDSVQLHNKMLTLDVIVKNSEEYGLQNSIKKHLAYDGKVLTPNNASVSSGSEGSSEKKNPWEV